MFFVNLIFSPTIKSFPYKSKKLKAMNHGINFRPVKNETNGRETNSIVCVGRVVPIKQLEILMKAIEKLSPVEFGVVLIGPLDNPKYYMEIANLANKFQINLVTLGELEKNAMIDEFMKFDYVFSGTPKSVDKAPLEAAGSGLVILTLNHELQVVSGLDHWFSNKFKISLEDLDITEQLRLYLSQGITSDERVDLARTVRSRNSLELLVGKITAMLNEVYR
jgi:glycosyltransferase involved in cell wall biosynthesis